MPHPRVQRETASINPRYGLGSIGRVNQDSRSSAAVQPQQMAVCLVEQDGRSSVLSLSLSKES